ncbi:MAG: hypothetical protein M1132_06170 [Chloroflexi bacterium]|nr:hypothetical protein [Chloroflexota bacterium]
MHGYCQGTLSRADAQALLGAGKTRFFALVGEHRSDPTAFSIAYGRETLDRLSVFFKNIAQVCEACLAGRTHAMYL